MTAFVEHLTTYEAYKEAIKYVRKIEKKRISQLYKE